MKTLRGTILSAIALLWASCAAAPFASALSEPPYRVQSEYLYYSGQAPILTCWVTAPRPRTYFLIDYYFYITEGDGEELCADGLPEDIRHYKFDRQVWADVALSIIRDLEAWLAQGPDLDFLSGILDCRDASRSLDIQMIWFPVITRASELEVSFTILCPDPIPSVRATIGFSYDQHVRQLIAEQKGVLWQ